MQKFKKLALMRFCIAAMKPETKKIRKNDAN